MSFHRSFNWHSPNYMYISYNVVSQCVFYLDIWRFCSTICSWNYNMEGIIVYITTEADLLREPQECSQNHNAYIMPTFSKCYIAPDSWLKYVIVFIAELHISVSNKAKHDHNTNATLVIASSRYRHRTLSLSHSYKGVLSKNHAFRLIIKIWNIFFSEWPHGV